MPPSCFTDASDTTTFTMEKITDTHSHIYLDEFDNDRAEVIFRVRQAGIERLLLPNVDSQTFGAMMQCCADWPDLCRPMVGLHPTSVNAGYEQEMAFVEDMMRRHEGEFVAVGEIGMDLYWDKTFVHEQMMVLDRQIRLAIDHDLPVVIHCRDAFPQLFEVLFRFKGVEGFRGVIHSFSGDMDDARRVLELGTFMLGINGVVTFKKSHLPALLNAVVPPSMVLLETDCPYLTPVPFRGKRNESSYVRYVLTKLADIYGMSEDSMAAFTTAAARSLFPKAY